MNDFAGMEDLLSDFLMEAGDMLSDVDSKLMELEKSPGESGLLNEIFRGFHTIKGGAGFLNAGELVTLCHLTENLFDKLRNHELTLSAELMDVIFAATAEVRRMFSSLLSGRARLKNWREPSTRRAARSSSPRSRPSPTPSSGPTRFCPPSPRESER